MSTLWTNDLAVEGRKCLINVNQQVVLVGVTVANKVAKSQFVVGPGDRLSSAFSLAGRHSEEGAQSIRPICGPVLCYKAYQCHPDVIVQTGSSLGTRAHLEQYLSSRQGWCTDRRIATGGLLVGKYSSV